VNIPSSSTGLNSAWSRFWFQPTDPSTLGFMRILLGLLLLYIHLAYCLDLQAFFGPKAYWGTDVANRERKESPATLSNWGWEPVQPLISTPQLPEQRVAVFDFLRHIPTTKAERESKFEYLFQTLELGSRGLPVVERNYQVAMAMLFSLPDLDDAKQARMLAELSKNAPTEKNLKPSVPDYVLTMSPSERLKWWNSAQTFLTALPGNSENFTLVIEWLQGLRPNQRQELAKYIRDLPVGEEGQRIIEYFDTWQNDPRQIYSKGRPIFSIWLHVTSPASMWFFHIMFLVIFALFTLGFCTRVTSVLTWLAALCYIHRMQYVLFGMDAMMSILLFYLMIAPSGAALSVDRLIARYRATKALARAGGKRVAWAEAVLAGPQPSAIANFAVRLFQIHFCFIYLASGLAKLKGSMWWNTSAAWLIMANPEFCPVHYELYENALHLLASYRPILQLVFMIVSYFTLVLEISLPFLIWTRMRPFVFICAVFLHTGIAWVMGLTCFGLLMMTLLLCYVPASVIRNYLTWPPGAGSKMTLQYSSRSRSQVRLASFLRALDFSNQITLVENPRSKLYDPDPLDAHAQLTLADGKSVRGGDAAAEAIRNFVHGSKFSWLLWVPGVSLILNAAFRRA